MSQLRIRIEGEESGFEQAAPDTVLRAALRAGVGFPFECNSGGCGSCKFEVLEGEVENIWPDAPGLTDRDRRKGRLLACQCRANTDLRIRVRTAPECRLPIEPKRIRAKFVAMHDISHDIREFRFITQERAAFLAGQYAMLAIPGVSSSRAYSMSNVANDEGEWHFQIRRVVNGAATERLFHHLHVGDEIEIDGPYGLAYLRTEVERDIVCIAGGSGLAPMVSIARAAAAAGMLSSRKLHFFYGARTPRDVCGEVMLQDMRMDPSSILYQAVVSSPETGEVPWTGRTGFVHEALAPCLGDDLAKFEFYFAGPPPMTQALQEMLMVTCRVPYQQIHFDRFF